MNKSLHRLVSTLAILTAFSLSAAPIVYNDFSDTTGLTLVGNAAAVSNALRLTPALENQVGGAWLSDKVDVQAGFEAYFQFRISNRGGWKPDWEPGVNNDGADGFAFVIQNAGPVALGLYASGLGYYGIANSLAIEFDTWNNKPSYCEPNGNHIAVQSLGKAENRPEHCEDQGGTFTNPTLGISTVSQDLSNGTVYDAKITYGGGLLKVYLDNLATPLLSVGVNLSTLLNLENGSNAYIGFTSSTGGAWENHDIVKFSLNAVPEPGTWVLIGFGLVGLGAARRRS